jgi:hypothetical protein
MNATMIGIALSRIALVASHPAVRIGVIVITALAQASTVMRSPKPPLRIN